ncbi:MULTISPECIES: VPA1267 family protein [Ramlibacter]|uniref:Uncharacterized protein n=1 Tax=Ramlibacter pinisoli TaxID=2682844 RepID=A0A6N8IUP7_9BURK|nr:MULTISPECIES: VPA1267 family protein [Ramlibacter]MBA2964688.1 hypothetical protein [Ramlibacter sp. CGMCC 1.13660]MVQ29653.1 hypothetical protein [Ramlibacter pinisoli]
MNGQDKGAEHFAAFTRWAAELTDADARSMVRGGQLNRAEICKAVGCARSVLRQNPRVKGALEELEAGLRARGILPPTSVSEVLPLRPQGQLQRSTERERLRQLEVENAALLATVSELRRRLQRLETLDALVAQSGRLPR